MIDLNYAVANLNGWTLESAAAINDLGQIVGYGTIDGVEHAFLLDPGMVAVPEPSTYVIGVLLLALALPQVRKFSLRNRPGSMREQQA
jgi:probable HAF family extracellular repeat protein